jgi:uridine phosphorylase
MHSPPDQSELILREDDRVYHLRLRADDIASTVVLVGDPERVSQVSSFFEKTESRHAHREFITHTGYYSGKRLTVMSTGIGTDNVDIVMNELDAAVNFDVRTRQPRTHLESLNLVRLGTTGGLQEDLGIDEIVLSEYAIGLDCLMNYYSGAAQASEPALSEAFIAHMQWPQQLHYPYAYAGDKKLLGHLGSGSFARGITVTAPGFYGPQDRTLRLQPAPGSLAEKLRTFRYGDLKITNFEMESSALYGLSRLLGHRCVTACVVIANRVRGEFSRNYEASVKRLITKTLDHISAITP